MEKSSFGTLGRNVLFLIVTYAATFVAVQVTQRLFAPESLAPVFSMTFIQIVAFAAARRVGARLGGYLAGWFGSTLLAEFVIQTIFGVRSLHSAPVHYAVALAAVLAVGVGALLAPEPATTSAASERSQQVVR